MTGTRRSWESVVIAALAYPANLALAGLAAFVLTLPLVTWLVAATAAGRALHQWTAVGDDAVFTNTFREFGVVWRRLLPISIAATVVLLMLVTNLLFLSDQGAPVAFLFGMATVPVAAMFTLMVTLLPAATVRDPDGSATLWLRHTLTLAAQRPLLSLILAAIVIGFTLTCVLLPTIVPFLGLSLPVWLGLMTVRR